MSFPTLSSVAATIEIPSTDRLATAQAILGARIAEARAARPSHLLATLAERVNTAPWDEPPAPALSEIPDELWGPYAEWLLAVPVFPSHPAEARTLAAHLAQRIDEIAGWMERNLGSPSVRAAAESLLRLQVPALSYFPADLRLPLQKARARVFVRLQGRILPAGELAPAPRAGRALRIGILQRAYDARPETFATLAAITQLDRQRFEVVLFSREATYSDCENHCRENATSFQALPETTAAQLSALRAEKLDVLIFAENLATHPTHDALLALQRIAPLQAVTAATPATTALPAIDLYISGELDASPTLAAQLTERLALLPATASAFDFTPDRKSDFVPVGRAELGLPLQPALLIVVAPSGAVAPSTVARWARTLAAQPDACLLILPVSAATPSDRLRAQFETACATASIASHRLFFQFEPALSISELQARLALADLCLDLPAHLVALALEAGVPLLTLDVSENAPSIALLRAAGLETQIADSESSFIAESRRLIDDADARNALRNTLAAASARQPRFADAYVTATDFGALLETAFDELAARGPRLFRKNREPIRIAAPLSLVPEELQAQGRELLAFGRAELAVPCLLSALQRAGDNASLWFDLARAYRDAGQTHSSLETLEASLRLDDKNHEGWIMLCELAADAGSLDLAREAFALAAALAPADERLPALRTRIAA